MNIKDKENNTDWIDQTGEVELSEKILL